MNIITPINGYIVAESYKDETITKSGFYMAKDSSEPVAIVVATSVDKVSVGDKVIYTRYTSEYSNNLIIHESDIVGILK